MADVDLTPTVPGMDGTAFSWVSADSADVYYFANPGNCVLIIRTSSAAARTLTIGRFATFDGEAVADREIDIGADAIEMAIGVFPTAIYSIKSGSHLGEGKFSFDVDTNVTFMLLRLI